MRMSGCLACSYFVSCFFFLFYLHLRLHILLLALHGLLHSSKVMSRKFCLRIDSMSGGIEIDD